MRPRGPFRRRRRVAYDVPPEERTTVVEERRRPGPPPEEPGRALWPWLLALLLLVLAGLAAAYFLTVDDDEEAQTRTVVAIQVPSLVGLDRNAAVRQVNRAGLRARVREVNSRERAGRVVAQDPPAGEEVRRGRTIVMNVSKGPPPVDVPDLLGLSEAQAASRLTRLGLRANVVRVPSAEPDGRVVAQRPPAGERLAAGESVRLNVSTGTTATETTETDTIETETTETDTIETTTTTTGTTTTARRTVEVPDVFGLREAQAVPRIERVGLVADSYPVRSAEPAGTVTGQRPLGGTTLRQGSVVRLNVALGTEPRELSTIPDVTGSTERAARRLLRRSGFTVRTIYRRATDPEDVGEVLLQSPPAGREARVLDQVTIYVGRR